VKNEKKLQNYSFVIGYWRQFVTTFAIYIKVLFFVRIQKIVD